MRLLNFRVGNYRVLKDLAVDFRRSEDIPKEEYALDFLAGVNGTGKSTLLHLLGRLFVWLEKNDWFPVPIEMEYELKNETQIRISNFSNEDTPFDEKLRYRIDDDPEAEGKLPERYLPRRVVMYTTGDEQAWKVLLKLEENEPQAAGALPDQEDLTDWYLEELPGNIPQQIDLELVKETPELSKRMLFIQYDRLPAVALCGLLASHSRNNAGEKETLHEALESVGIEKLVGFSLRCRVHKGLILPVQEETIARLRQGAQRVIQQGADQLLVFDLEQQAQDDVPKSDNIYQIYEGQPLSLFQAINSLYEHRPFQDPPLQEVNLFFKRRSVEDTETEPILHLWDWLSDGERSFLARMALFALFREDDILILMDEPEVHFNDVWKREVVNMLDRILRGKSSHAVITTHSSIALSDVSRGNILVLTRDGNYVTDGSEPPMETFGADPSDIMMHVFGTHHASGEHSVRFIREKIGQANNQGDLESLRDSIAPGYWRYRVQLELEHFAARQ